ncbi:hypothetical protein CAMRE0001_1589 [Campylobacter rectus RM3267]|uniref:Uncharacterized protein n=1 Tax=Campylobacter rectus RM3267 TaxID=553218 RepID=B9CZ17_CAMRE|nr:hypothetical protein CAMRE0001_1589 [Campylobacter rectus RM3267]
MYVYDYIFHDFAFFRPRPPLNFSFRKLRRYFLVKKPPE